MMSLDVDSVPPFSRVAYFIAILLGFGVLITWNIALNATTYFQIIFTKNSNMFPFYQTAAYMYPQLPTIFTMMGLNLDKKWSSRSRIVYSLLGQILAMVLLAIPPVSKNGGMVVVLILTAFVGFCTAVLQSSMFAFTSIFPPILNQGFMGGQGLAGILSGVAMIILLLAIPDKSTDATSSANEAPNETRSIIYFAFAAASLVITLLGYLRLIRMPFTHYYERRAAQTNSTDSDDTAVLAADSSAPLLDNDSQKIELLGAEPVHVPQTYRQALRLCWVEALSVFTVFFVTFLGFPSLAPSQVTYTGLFGKKIFGQADTTMWWPTLLYLVFNVFDTCGRYLPGLVIAVRRRSLLVTTLFRFAVIPVFYGCAKGWHGFNDLVALLVMAAFAVTNGYLASISMMTGPAQAPPSLRGKAGFIMTVALQAGILFGQIVSFAFSPPSAG